VPTTTTTAPPRRSPVITRVILLVGLLVIVAALVWQVHEARKPSTGGDPHTDNPALSAVQTFDYVGGQHTKDPVTYAQTPPAGGQHDPVWDDCGVYTDPIRNENGVHDLEHGTVWITYRPDLSAADVQSLETALGTVKSEKTILSPYPGLPAPVVATVWNAQLALKGADDSRLPIFLKEYGDGHTAPEAAFATCKGGAHIMASPDTP
jgi:Protein of unknown function (DUF3105)